MTEAASGSSTQNSKDAPKGLQIRRVYTREGVHPYDELTWERRDVVMTNWRDGSVNFEQHGVEFPDSWSVNAANIVTTKYFRGAVGTPQREWSLKQLIDRVVSTYVEAGRKHDYFASEKDAEIFDHELTYALVHQIFAFNSPVWFNVGTSSPWQVSACFILAVDDTMESILEWYREEGLIFKGGSGAGVNLSRIRSSRELLASGGTASGPVSFMRGADASAGTIKSGGATRRAAKMVVLDVDHPDVEEFIETKAREEEKVRVLRDAGFDMDLGGKDIVSVQYQNANNSVRVSDEFMRAVEQNADFDLLARQTGQPLRTVKAKGLFRQMAKAAWECADPGIQYDDTINSWHTCPESGRITASNPCSEYVHLDNSSCNLASINLLKFLRDDDTFDVERFQRVTELIITAMDISICFADFPTEKITATTRAYRQLGIGYANLGALLMATGHAYDSDGGRAIAGAITSLMTGTAYRRSAELAKVVGPYDGYARNAVPHKAVIAKHAAASRAMPKPAGRDASILTAANHAWDDARTLGEAHGYRNAQASLLAPTGCLTGDTLVTTSRGLTRLSELGDIYGDRWQDLDLDVSTDDGARRATKFFVNGEEATRLVSTEGGYRIQGTLTHRVKVVDERTGDWEWKRLADVAAGDLLPLQFGTLVGEPRSVPLPVLDEAYYTSDRHLGVPDEVTDDLAELVGYFMGDGSLHAKGLRFCVADGDDDVADRLELLGKELFGLTPVRAQRQGYVELTLQSVRLARWWQAAGFAKSLPEPGHAGKGSVPRVPSAILETNNAEIYAAFLRGLFEADGAVLEGVPSVSSASRSFADEVRTLLLVLGLATTTRQTRSGWGGPIWAVRLRNVDHAQSFGEIVGFMGRRKSELVTVLEPVASAKNDYVVLPKTQWAELVPVGHSARDAVLQSVRKHRGVPRMLARRLFGETFDPRLGRALGFLYERVAANDDGGVRPTYDLSVPENVTYVANGIISHNTIGLMMDCDTTGVEPDLALVKFKKLVGGGSMQIVNQTVPRALKNLGYLPEQAEAIIEYIAEHGNVVGAPGLKPEHYEVFDCAMGDRAISAMGHVRMMAAVQPALSGAISKTVNLPESATIEDIEKIYFEGWKLGLKALAIYRDNCKVGQPLSASKRKPEAASDAAAQPTQAPAPHDHRPVRRRLPKQRSAMVTRFSVAGSEGYMTASTYPDDGLGEVFLKLGKQGSTLAGVMDAFSIAISVGLQYGIPLETWVSKFTNMRFEPAGITDDPDIRMVSSVMDYIFRRLALDHLPYDRRAELGILSVAERTAALDSADAAAAAEEVDPEELAQSAPREEPKSVAKPSEYLQDPQQPIARTANSPSGPHSSTELIESHQGRIADAPLCLTCGTKMRPAGSCYVCEGCGSTSGCS
ncbi:MAG TPA: vitamin B12-dependent ribonucleotide reductase [Streptosporangiaceae bacterium]|nr:vitamin B12-dependent ribonucleotide reductase [Streptosporangiaceae bacterium]